MEKKGRTAPVENLDHQLTTVWQDGRPHLGCNSHLWDCKEEHWFLADHQPPESPRVISIKHKYVVKLSFEALWGCWKWFQDSSSTVFESFLTFAAAFLQQISALWPWGHRRQGSRGWWSHCWAGRCFRSQILSSVWSRCRCAGEFCGHSSVCWPFVGWPGSPSPWSCGSRSHGAARPRKWSLNTSVFALLSFVHFPVPALGSPPCLLFLGGEVYRRVDFGAAVPTRSKHCRHSAPPGRASIRIYISRDFLHLRLFPTAPGRRPVHNSLGRYCSFGFVHVALETLFPKDLPTCAEHFSLLDPGWSLEAEISDGLSLEWANMDRQIDKHFRQLRNALLWFYFGLCNSKVLPLCCDSSVFWCPRSFLDVSFGLSKLSVKGSGNLFGLLWASFTEKKAEMADRWPLCDAGNCIFSFVFSSLGTF